MYGMMPMGVFFIAIFPLEINEQALCQQPQHDQKHPYSHHAFTLLQILHAPPPMQIKGTSKTRNIPIALTTMIF